MNVGTIIMLYGLFLELVAATALSNPVRWSAQKGSPRGSEHSSTGLNLCMLWIGILVQTTGLAVPSLRVLMVSPIQTWFVLTALVCLMSWFIYVALTPTGKSIRMSVQSWLGKSGRKDTSGVPSEIARTLQRKTKLARLPHETDSDYINRCRDHIVRKLSRGES